VPPSLPTDEPSAPVPSVEPLPEPTEASPGAATRTPLQPTPTRASVSRPDSGVVTRVSNSNLTNEAQSLNTRLLSGVVLSGGLLVGGCGFIVLFGAVVWYYMSRRPPWRY
jgi:hypothetical protein